MVFQDPMSSLNPVFTVGNQIAEAMKVHDRSLTDRAARRRSIELLELVGVPQPDERYASTRTSTPAGCASAR
jgi:peptide/nickel transport system ATP-binding protein